MSTGTFKELRIKVSKMEVESLHINRTVHELAKEKAIRLGHKIPEKAKFFEQYDPAEQVYNCLWQGE